MTEPAAGSIYDLGYRRYEGARLGRSQALLAIYLSSLRSIFGLGRGTGAKFFPIGLAILAFIPAVIQLGIGAVITEDIEIFRAEDYYDYVRIILVLFIAATAPSLMGRDQRDRTLALYFSRAILRRDYVAARLGALCTALLVLTLAPQLLLYIGNGLATNDAWGYIRDEWTQVFPIVLSAILLSAFMSAIGAAIGCQSPRRAWTTVAILGLFLLTGIVAGILLELANDVVGSVAMLFSPFDVNTGATYWLFGLDLADTELGQSEIPGWGYAVAAVAWTAIAAAIVVARYERLEP
ncbi:MAG: ABC transporter permease subunit [Dehalococcoidia bacterium]|nr:ABC transporter permease subunit [Dehalococcoidia bacterium]